MSRQYFRELIEPVVMADLTAVTAAAATAWWPSATYSAIPAAAAKPGQAYAISAWGVITTTATPGTVIIDPRYATTAAGGVSLGASSAVALPASMTAQPWYLEMWFQFRNVNNGAASSSTASCLGRASFGFVGTNVSFGGSLVTNVDTSIASGLLIAGTFSVATGSLTPRGILFEAIN